MKIDLKKSFWHLKVNESRNIYYDISFSIKKNRYNLIDYNHFKNLVYDSFKFKRKTLRNNLKSYDLSIISKVLMNYGFDLSIRAEKLSVEIFVNLSNSLCKREF